MIKKKTDCPKTKKATLVISFPDSLTIYQSP
jgi:hypothetical protein